MPSPVYVSFHNMGSRPMKLTADRPVLCAQWDNNSTVLHFKRPEEFIAYDMQITFYDGVNTFSTVNLGRNNSFMVGNKYTTQRKLGISVSFVTVNGQELENTEKYEFSLRATLRPTVEPTPISLDNLAITGVEVDQETGVIVFLNRYGVELAEINVRELAKEPEPDIEPDIETEG